MKLDNEIARYEASELRELANLKMAMQYEIVVVGGGMAGMTLACALAGSGISTAVVDRLDPSSMKTAAFDGRTTSIAHGSAQVLKGIGLWPLVEDAAEPILDIRVADGHPARGVSPLFLVCNNNNKHERPPFERLEPALDVKLAARQQQRARSRPGRSCPCPGSGS